MKAKLYSQLDFLSCEEAIEYASEILGVELNHKEFERFVLPRLDCYLDFTPDIENLIEGSIFSKDCQTGVTHIKPIGNKPHKISGGFAVYISIFGAYFKEIGGDEWDTPMLLTGHCAEYIWRDEQIGDDMGVVTWTLEPYIETGILDEHRFGKYKALDGIDPEIVFSVSNIEALATKIKDEPCHQALQEENERLQQEVDALRAENAKLKADDEINPKKEEALYKLIICMAMDGYGHNPTGNNSTAKELGGALARLGIPLGERTIRKHLNAAKEFLPSKPIDT